MTDRRHYSKRMARSVLSPSLVSGLTFRAPLKPTRCPRRIIRKPLCIVWAFPSIVLSSYTQLGFSCTRGIQLRFSSSFSSSFLIPALFLLRPFSLFLSSLLSSTTFLSPLPSHFTENSMILFSIHSSFCCLFGQTSGRDKKLRTLCRKRMHRQLSRETSGSLVFQDRVTIASSVSSNVRGRSDIRRLKRLTESRTILATKMRAHREWRTIYELYIYNTYLRDVCKHFLQ